MLPDMSIFIGPQNRHTFLMIGGILLICIIFMATCFFLARIRKIHHLSKIYPEREYRYKYHGLLLFLNYICYALLVFIVTVLLSGGPLAGIVYLAVWLTKGEAPFVPLFSAAIIFGIAMGLYGTFMFLRSKGIYEESQQMQHA
jgi:hypothetical protein